MEPNRFFVYDGNTLIAAQNKFTVAMRYFSIRRQIFWGTPENHLREITSIANKLKFIS